MRHCATLAQQDTSAWEAGPLPRFVWQVTSARQRPRDRMASNVPLARINLSKVGRSASRVHPASTATNLDRLLPQVIVLAATTASKGQQQRILLLPQQREASARQESTVSQAQLCHVTACLGTLAPAL